MIKYIIEPIQKTAAGKNQKILSTNITTITILLADKKNIVSFSYGDQIF